MLGAAKNWDVLIAAWAETQPVRRDFRRKTGCQRTGCGKGAEILSRWQHAPYAQHALRP